MQRVRILQDNNPMNPRECDTAGRMICFHSQYNLGDDHNYDSADLMSELAFEADSDCEDYVTRLEEIGERLYDRAANNGCDTYTECLDYSERFIRERIIDCIEKAVRAGYVILPLYLYEHSGIAMSTGSFACPWDSGQVGCIICDNETIKREFNGDRDLAEKYLESEVSVYDDYIRGNVYGFIVEETDEFDEDGDPVWDDPEETDSYWGFFGSDPRTNGMDGHLDAELLALAIDADIEY